MATESEVREGKKVRLTNTRRAAKRAEEVKATPLPVKPRPEVREKQEVKPIQKRNEWKLLYAPQPPVGGPIAWPDRHSVPALPMSRPPALPVGISRARWTD